MALGDFSFTVFAACIAEVRSLFKIYRKRPSLFYNDDNTNNNNNSKLPRPVYNTNLKQTPPPWWCLLTHSGPVAVNVGVFFTVYTIRAYIPGFNK